ncbi:MAG: TrmB family transcriptional regulator [Euryarchaeota archaeon]|nr:TrmB family transcriptional regulator [Euryarchaeota archaeon]
MTGMLEEKLKNLGLNHYEIRTYLALLSSDRESLQASELSGASGVPMARIYDIMDSLEKKGFARIGLGRPTLYQALAPEEALENYRRKMEMEFDRRLQDYDKTKGDLVKELRKKRGAHPVSKVKDAFSLQEGDDLSVSLERVFMRARKRVYLLAGGGLKPDFYAPMMKNLADGVQARVLVSPGAGAKGAGVRELAREPPVSFCVADEEILLLNGAVGEAGLSGSGVWSNSRSLVEMAAWTFEQLWSQGGMPSADGRRRPTTAGERG